MASQWEALQKNICDRFGSKFVETPPDGRIGIALRTMGQTPVNGLRHPPHGNMVGWYIWGGQYSSDPDFFQVLHVSHLPQEFPYVMEFLGLAPGFRFLTDGNTVDVWFDEQLLTLK